MITQRKVSIPTILEDGQIQLREDTVYEENGVELFRQHHRRVLEPGDDVLAQPQRIQAICGAVWPPDVIAAYGAAKRARALAQP